MLGFKEINTSVFFFFFSVNNNKYCLLRCKLVKLDTSNGPRIETTVSIAHLNASIGTGRNDMLLRNKLMG